MRKEGLLTPATADAALGLAGLLKDRRLAGQATELRSHASGASGSRRSVTGERVAAAMLALANDRPLEALGIAAPIAQEPGESEARNVAALAAIRAGRTKEALTLLREIESQRGRLLLNPVIPFFVIELARAQAMTGHPTDARATYERAFDIWRGADPELPVLVAARQEYAALR